MPKRGNRGNQSWKNQYREHDYRSNGDNRRVNFKQSNIRFKKDWSNLVRTQLREDDYDMGGTSGARRNFDFRHFAKGGNRSDSSTLFPEKRRLLEGPLGWFRVHLPHGNKYEKAFVLRTLLEKVQPHTLWPIMWKNNGNSVTFFIDDVKCAEKLYDLDRQIQMPDGFKMLIKVSSGFPNVEINSDLKEKLKLTMAKRYNLATRALDLTKFHVDPNLQDVFCALFKPLILMTVLDIIAENIPEIEAINLFDNKICNLSFIKKLHEKLPNLKILHMGNNKIRDVTMLDYLIGLPIVEMVLHGNPLCSKFKDQEIYVGEIRKRFPKLMKLDGVDLPPPISFDINQEANIPQPSQTFLCNSDGEGIIREFLQLYIQIFDTDNRQPLIEAYHENALFSLTMAYPYGQRDKNVNWLNWYVTENRNIDRVTDPERRCKLLKQGKVAVVSFLQDMPQSKHDIQSFCVDLTLFTPQMICLSFSGMFKELKSGHKFPPIRYFFRTFIIVPAGSGFCIANETLHITNATEEQAKTAFKIITTPPPTPNTSLTNSSITQQLNNSIPDNLTKQQMIQTLSEQSTMNIEWSEKCLTETQWDFQRAITVFRELHSLGRIPDEAFQK